MLQPKIQSTKGVPSKSAPRYSPFYLLEGVFSSSLLNTETSKPMVHCTFPMPLVHNTTTASSFQRIDRTHPVKLDTSPTLNEKALDTHSSTLSPRPSKQRNSPLNHMHNSITGKYITLQNPTIVNENIPLRIPRNHQRRPYPRSSFFPRRQRRLSRHEPIR